MFSPIAIQLLSFFLIMIRTQMPQANLEMLHERNAKCSGTYVVEFEHNTMFATCVSRPYCTVKSVLCLSSTAVINAK